MFLFYNNYINNCSIKLIILNKEIIILIINKNNQITEFKLYKLIINNLIYKQYWKVIINKKLKNLINYNI